MREILLIIFIIASIPYVLKRPLVGIIIYLGANVVRPEMLFWGGDGGSYVFKVYYALIILSSVIQGNILKFKLALQREYLLMIWMLFAIYLSTIIGQNQFERQQYFIVELFKTFVICGILYSVIDNYHNIKNILLTILGCLTFLGIWGIEQSIRGNARLEGLGGNSWGDSNGVAAMYVLFLPIAVALYFNSKLRYKIILTIAVVSIMAALIVCTKSRAGLLGMITGLLVFGYFSRRTMQIVKIGAIISLAVLPFASEAYIDRMKTIQLGESDQIESSAGSRLILWQAGLMVFGDNPVFGTGFMTYPEAKMKYENEFMHLDDAFRSNIFRTVNKKVTHNTYIQMLSDCGLFGALPYFLIICGGILIGIKARRMLLIKADVEQENILLLCGISAGIAGFAVCIITMDSIMFSLLYVMIVLQAAMFRMLDNRNTTNHSNTQYDIH